MIFQLAELDKNKLIGPTVYSKKRKTIFFLVFYSVTSILGSIVPTMNAENKIHTMVHTIGFILPHIMNIWEAMLTRRIMVNLTKKFESINGSIRKQIKTAANLKKVLSLSAPQTFKKFEQEERKFTSERIRTIMDVHYDLVKLSRQVNELFGCPFLITTGINFEMVTLCVYYFIGGLVDVVSKTELLTSLVWPVFLSGEIIWIIRGYQGTAEKVLTHQKLKVVRNSSINSF